MSDSNTAIDTSKSNGADKSAGLAAVAAAIGATAPAAAPASALRSSTAPLPNASTRAAASERLLSAEREAVPPAPVFDGLNRFSQTAATTTATAVDARLDATTRMVNAFMGYLMTACGRTPDQMTSADVAAMGQLLGTVERLEVTPKLPRTGH